MSSIFSSAPGGSMGARALVSRDLVQADNDNIDDATTTTTTTTTTTNNEAPSTAELTNQYFPCQYHTMYYTM